MYVLNNTALALLALLSNYALGFVKCMSVVDKVVSAKWEKNVGRHLMEAGDSIQITGTCDCS